LQKFLVWENEVAGPAAHAIIIGVGRYRHLKGGGGRVSRKWHARMEQLLSPPDSARAFANWLLTSYNPPKHKLASVALLVSDKSDVTYKVPTSGAMVPVKQATTANVEKAVNQWYARANTSKDNMTIFFFCGHGTQSGPDTALLLQDYAQSDAFPLNGAVDFSKLHNRMDKCAARRQVYFVDACRIPTPSSLTEKESLGKDIVYGDEGDTGGEARQSVVYYSALRGTAAYSRDGQISQFTDMLLRSLSTAAGNYDGDGKWRINTLTLMSGINGYLERAADKKADVRQNPSAVVDVFNLHELNQAPLVPVFVYCCPREAARECELSCSNSSVTKNYPAGEEWGWDLELPRGDYTFDASSPANPARRGKAEDRPVQPTHARVEVEVLS